MPVGALRGELELDIGLPEQFLGLSSMPSEVELIRLLGSSNPLKCLVHELLRGSEVAMPLMADVLDRLLCECCTGSDDYSAGKKDLELAHVGLRRKWAGPQTGDADWSRLQ